MIQILVGISFRRLLVDYSIDAPIMYTVPLNLETFYINFLNGRNKDSFVSKPAHLSDSEIVLWCCFVNKRQGIC